MRRLLKWFLIIGGGLFGLSLLLFAGLFLWASGATPRIHSVTDYNPPVATTVYTSQQRILGYFSKEKRFLLRLEEMGPWIPSAFIAAEDREFRQHPGVDLTSIIRAALANLMAGRIVQGGSTIPQQVIDALIMDTGTSYLLKFKEAVLAYQLDRRLTKDQILAIYLNQIYLGEEAYGVEAAARTYFGKHAKELNLAEAALIAGLPRAPALYNPYDNPEAARSRQRYVLRQMKANGMITPEEYERALNRELDYRRMADPTWSRAGYYLQTVRNRLLEEFDKKRVYRGGLKVHTALDLSHHQAARAALREGLQSVSKRRGWRGPVRHLSSDAFPRFLRKNANATQRLKEGDWAKGLVTEVNQRRATLRLGNATGIISVESMQWARPINPEVPPEEASEIRDARKVLDRGDVVRASVVSRPESSGAPWRLALQQRPEVQGALIAMEPGTGHVRALVGGYSFAGSQFNRAVQASRQPGSAFKPVTYAAALKAGYTAASPLVDAPVVLPGDRSQSTWKPRNYSLHIRGKILLRTGLVHSINRATIRLAQEIGVARIMDQARALGFSGPFPQDLTLAIGSLDATPIALSRAYTAFARDGTTIEPTLITRIEDSWGKTIRKAEPATHRAMGPRTSFIMSELLRQVVQNGTAWRVKKLDRPAAGKTGTTNNQRDAWFAGYTPNLLATVYCGFDDPRSMGRYETGSRAVSPIWVDYMQKVLTQYPERDFRKPKGVVMAEIAADSGKLAGPRSGESFLLPFREENVPTEVDKGRAGEKRRLKQLF
jgi:penicillin-binding protein 1A